MLLLSGKNRLDVKSPMFKCGFKLLFSTKITYKLVLFVNWELTSN